jgi:hypothetical protein
VTPATAELPVRASTRSTPDVVNIVELTRENATVATNPG